MIPGSFHASQKKLWYRVILVLVLLRWTDGLFSSSVGGASPIGPIPSASFLHSSSHHVERGARKRNSEGARERRRILGGGGDSENVRPDGGARVKDAALRAGGAARMCV